MEQCRYKKLLAYYFSGTGNSAAVVEWVKEKAVTLGMSYEVISIAHTQRRNIPSPPEDALLLFCSPVHGFNYPPVMQAFIFHFPKGNNPVILMNTRAGMLIGKWITPGLSGITFYLAALILKVKGYRIRAMFPVDLPSNWISVHPGLNDRTVAYLHEKNKEKVGAFADHVLSGKTDFKSLREMVQDILVSPVSLGYYFAGRFLFSKTYYASNACTHCNLCVKQCPVKAIRLIDNRPYWTFHCESCMHCMSYCPVKAIETAHGSIMVYLLLFSVIIWSLVENFAGEILHLANPLLHLIVQTALILSLLALWYRIIHFLLRYQWFNRIITYTSLTHYKFWGKRYRATPKKNTIPDA